jgi:hypothetical protein
MGSGRRLADDPLERGSRSARRAAVLGVRILARVSIVDAPKLMVDLS